MDVVVITTYVVGLKQVMSVIALQRRLQNVGITLSSVDPGVVSD